METTFNFKYKELNDFAQLLFDNGFSIIYREKDPSTYFHFSLNDQIGYVQFSNYEGFSFSTVHIPHRNIGSGYGVLRDRLIGNPTIEDAKQAFVKCPEWVSISDSKVTKKFDSLDKFINYNSWNKENIVVTKNK